MNASLGFFEILFIIVLSFYLMGWLGRLVLPYLAKAYMKRMSARFGFEMPEQKQPKTTKAGKITINQPDETSRSGNLDNVGEYTDYEDVKG